MNDTKTTNQEWRKISKRKPKQDLSNYNEFLEIALARFSKVSLTDELFDDTGNHGPLVLLDKGHVPDLIRYKRNFDRNLSFYNNPKPEYNTFQRSKPNYTQNQNQRHEQTHRKEIGIKGNLQTLKHKSNQAYDEEEEEPEWADIEINEIIHGHQFKSLPNNNQEAQSEEEEIQDISRDKSEESNNHGIMDGRIDLSVLQKMNQNLFQNEDPTEPNVLDELLGDENSNDESENSSKVEDNQDQEEKLQEGFNIGNINNVKLNLNPVNQYGNINNVNPLGFNNNIRQQNFMPFQNNMMNNPPFPQNLNKGQFNMQMNQNINPPFMHMPPHMNPMFNQNPRVNFNMNPNMGFNPNSIPMNNMNNIGNNHMIGNMQKFPGMANSNMFNMPFSPSNGMNNMNNRFNQMNMIPNNPMMKNNMFIGPPNQKSADSRALECIYKNLIDKGWIVQVKNKQMQKLNSYELFEMLDKFLVENENNLERILIQDFHSDSLFHPKVLWHILFNILPLGNKKTSSEKSSRKSVKGKSTKSIKINEDSEDKGKPYVITL